ncbi:MAG: hypothetical protein JWP12_3475 [Bacteroidetes bacterium]|nr:hypothetical protein [Bacteroidota bacterium]
MKKITIILGLISVVTVKSYAQKSLGGSSDSPVTVTMTDENTNPDYIEGHIPFLELDFAKSNSTLFADFGGKLKIKRFYADLDFHVSYANGLDEFYYTEPIITANSVYAYKASKDFRAMLGFVLVQKEVATTVKFHLKSVGQTSYVTKVPTKKTFFVMADLGFRKGFTWVYGGGKDLTFTNVNSPEGFTPPDPTVTRTMMDYTMLQVGVSTGSLGFYKANISGYGDRRAEQSVRYYLDMLVLLGSKIDDVYQKNDLGGNLDNTLYTRYGLNDSKRSKVGFCLGAQLDNISRFGIAGGVETGYIPGIKGNFGSNFCFSIKSSLSLAKILN